MVFQNFESQRLRYCVGGDDDETDETKGREMDVRIDFSKSDGWGSPVIFFIFFYNFIVISR